VVHDSNLNIFYLGIFKQQYVLILSSNQTQNFLQCLSSKTLLLVKVKVFLQTQGNEVTLYNHINKLSKIWFIVRFVKTWRVANSGDDRWPDGCYLAFTGGVNLASQASVPVMPLNPGETTDISVDMSSPIEPGMYESKWRMATSYGAFFGG
jgi:Ig-like domain from next to BRCA1 gene